MKKQIVLLADGFMNWAGGVDFFKINATALLETYDPEKYNVTILLPEKKFFGKFSRLLMKIPLLKTVITYFKKNPFEKGKVSYCSFGKKRVNRSLKKLGADLALFCWSDIPIETADIGYYPDLQHKHFPHYFSEKERENRERTIENLLATREGVIVTSKDVKKDFETFFPKTTCEIFPLPFSPILLDTDWLNPLLYDVKKKYAIQKPYFMISNQFWIHKDHLTAFKALKELPDIHLVCTGGEDDFRFPGYYQELLDTLAKWGIKERVHLLGHIPKRDQIELMKYSIGVVQPTRFEGGPGGGMLYNAVALGVPAIVSDIPVNQEISKSHAHFFKVGDSEDLLAKMRGLLKEERHLPSKEILLKNHRENTARLGSVLLEIIEKFGKRGIRTLDTREGMRP
ncbi:MAG: hypothetical protein S4CHLAM45_01150 [Chlamydiales bacterium]|nr:hypothetical protein [Chlamydiales bacterium]MCH9619436.1 hypothetical protein [Chlamydiales bacterium]MCH9622240.1 hypothetical protein [Chlamydiales bacterium]